MELLVTKVSMKLKFLVCDSILREFKTQKTRDYILYMLKYHDKLISYDKTLDCYIVKDRYLNFYSKKLKGINKWSCQCRWRSYYTSICSHIAVIQLLNVLTLDNDLVDSYIYYTAKKETYRRYLRRRSFKKFSKL